MNCNEIFNIGIFYATDAYKRVCRFNEELHEDLEKYRAENAKLRELLLDVWNDAMQFDGFWDYVHDDGEIYNEDELPHYLERMQDLGIEVKYRSDAPEWSAETKWPKSAMEIVNNGKGSRR